MQCLIVCHPFINKWFQLEVFFLRQFVCRRRRTLQVYSSTALMGICTDWPFQLVNQNNAHSICIRTVCVLDAYHCLCSQHANECLLTGPFEWRMNIDTQRHLVYKCLLICTLYTYTYAKYTDTLLRMLAFVILKKKKKKVKSTRKLYSVVWIHVAYMKYSVQWLCTEHFTHRPNWIFTR